MTPHELAEMQANVFKAKIEKMCTRGFDISTDADGNIEVVRIYRDEDGVLCKHRAPLDIVPF